MTTSNIGCLFRYVVCFCFLSIAIINAEAQKCTSTSDGSIQNFLGTDFNHKKDKGNKHNDFAYPIEEAVSVTPFSVRVLPDGKPYEGFQDLIPFDAVTDRKNLQSYTDDAHSYIVTDSLNTLFPNGRGKPMSWKDGENAFLVTKGGSGPNQYSNASLCGLYFPGKYFWGRTVRFTYRVYIIEVDQTKRCKDGLGWHPAAYQVKMGLHGTDAYNSMNAWVTPDGQPTKEILGIPAGDGVKLTNVEGDPLAVSTKEHIVCDNYEYDGPDVNIGYTVTYEYTFPLYEKPYFGLWPMVQTDPYFADNYRIVFDYINFSIEHVCSDRDSICPGDEIGLSAVDFPIGTQLEWQYSVNNTTNFKTFKTTTIETANDQIFFPSSLTKVLRAGDRVYFRTNNVNAPATDNTKYSILIEVGVSDPKYCAPDTPELTVKDMCAPSTQKLLISNSSPSADYNWKLIDPNGKDVTSSIIDFDDVADSHHSSAIIDANVNTSEGKYTLIVSGRNNSIVDATSGDAKFEFYIYQTPSLKLDIYNESGNQQTSLCPSTLMKSNYTAKLTDIKGVYNMGNFTYNWVNGTADAANPYIAVLGSGDNSASYCAGTADNFKVSVTVNNHSCSAKFDKELPVEKPAGPFINCDDLVIPVLELEATKNDIEYSFTLPNIYTQCGETPNVKISITGPDNAAISFVKNGEKVTAVYPLGVSTVTITATDDCGNVKQCVKSVKVVDVTPPRIDCSKLPSYSTMLSYYNSCLATPGQGVKPTELPLLANPVLEDLDHPGDMLTGIFVSRSDGKSLNDPFEVGETIIRWKFQDASKNTAYCNQTVVVIDDSKPVVNCTTTDGVLIVNTDDGKCFATGSLVWNQILEQLDGGVEPSARLACSAADVALVKNTYIKSEKDAKYAIFNKAETLEKDVVYSLVWSFKKKSDNSMVNADSAICEQKFKVTDNEQPNVVCGNVSSYVVTVNYKKNDLAYKYDYASGKVSDVFTQYTATSIIENVPTATDNCGPISLVVTLDSANATSHPFLSITGTNEEIVAALRQIKFYQGTSTSITYTFSDGAKNTAECLKTISVIDRSAPMAQCFTPEEVVLSADEHCTGLYAGATLEKILSEHMATMSFDRFTTIYERIGGAWVQKGSVLRETVNYKGEVAPSSVVRQHYSKNEAGEYVLDKSDVGYAKPGLHTDADKGSYKIAKIQVSHFDGIPARPDEISQYRLVPTKGTLADGVDGHYVLVNKDAVLDTKFELGKTVLTFWYTNGDLYENGVFKEKGDSVSCTLTVIVEDKTDPTVVCGIYEGEHKHELLTNACTWPFDLQEPTIALLNGDDNCTEKENLKLSYIRKFEDGKTEDLKEDFKIGTTTLTWVVTDESNNKVTCSNTIIVEDKKGPEFDCDKVTPKNVTAYADENCEVLYSKLNELGLVTPKSINDACSPVGSSDSIYAVGSRSDGKALTEPFEKVNSPIVITWTVKDAFNNESYCYQNIVIEDTTAPVFPDCDNLKDLIFDVAAGECTVPGSEVEALLGSHTAHDNCDGDIVGVPGVGVNGKDPLPSFYPVDTTVVTWVFTDKSGISSYCPQLIIVDDHNKPDPSAICPKEPFLADAVKGTCETTVSLPELKLFDKCDNTDLVGVFKRFDDTTKTVSDPFPVGETNVSWIFTDKHGNFGVCESKVVVKDVTPPILYCNTTVNDSLIFSISGDICGVDPADVVNNIQVPYAYDECDKERINAYVSKRWYKGLTGTDSPVLITDASGNPVAWDDESVIYKSGYTDIYFIFADAAGNADSCKLSVYINERNTPRINCDVAVPTPVKLSPAANACELNWTDIDLDKLNPGQAYDVCRDIYIKGKPINANGGRLIPGEENIPEKIVAGDTLNLIWYFVSDAGNQVNCPQSIIVVDGQKPEVDCDAIASNKITVSAENEKCFASGTVILDMLKPYPVATDNCGDITGVPSRSDKLDLNAPYPTGTTTITWTFSDSNPENTVTCSQEVFVKGSIAPAIDCDTFKTFFDTIPECDTRTFSVRIPYGEDVCAPESLKNVKGEAVRSDGADLNAPYPLGNTFITWTFSDFTNSVSSSCIDTVNVRTRLKLEMECKDIVVPAEVGECSKTIEIEQPVAKHPCLDVTVPGLPYIGGTKLTVTDGKVSYNFRAGVTKLIWVFADTTKSLVKDVDTCEMNVQIGNSNEMPVNCDNYPAIKKSLVGKCSVDASELSFNDPEVKDLCTGQIIPAIIYRTSNPETKTDDPNKLGVFSVGVQDTIVRLYVFQSDGQLKADSMLCRQPVWLRDSLNIKTNCLPDDSVTVLLADEGVCDMATDALLDKIGTPEATDECLDHKIPGVATLKDGSPLPTSVAVGDTITIQWMFNDPLANADSAYCYQKVTVKTDAAPIFDCSSLDSLKFIAEGKCSVSLTETDVPKPVAKDSCTGKDVVAVGTRSDGKDLYADFEVGYTTITWLFESPSSTTTKTCEQVVYVKTDIAPDFDCNDLGFLAAFADGQCYLTQKQVLDLIGEPVGKEHCTQKDVPGVPTLVNGDPLPEQFPVGDTITIRWTFALPEFTTGVKTCDQGVTVNGNAAPKFDCTTLDTLHFTASGECSIDLKPSDIPVPVAKDGCAEDGADVPGVGSRADGGAIDGIYNVGPTVITWTFKSLSSSEVKTCDQTVWVKTDIEIDANCDKTNYPDVKVAIADGSCTVDASGILAQLTNHEALNPCNDAVVIKSVPSRSDNLDMDAEYPMGNTTIIWTFTDTTNTLVNPVSTCEQLVVVGDENKPLVDCPTTFPNVKLYLDEDNCSADFAAIPVHLAGLPLNPCSGERAELDTLRASGKGMHEPYTVGVETITWKFVFKATNQQVVCNQQVEVLDTIAPKFDCSILADTIEVAITKAGTSVTYGEVVAAGFAVPQVTDKCTDVTTTTKRSDGLMVEDNYVLGKTKVTFVFSDIYNNSDSCSQIIKVVDMVPPKVICPKLVNDRFACLTDTVPAYASYEEFKAAGGSVEDEAKVDLSSFHHTDVVVGDECETSIARNYFFTTVTGVEVSCEVPQQLFVKDTIAPTYVGVPANGASFNTSCDALEIEPLVVTAIDNCDPNPVVTYTSYSTQGSDPSLCDYYTYDVVYTYVAVDRCGMAADPVTYTVHVKDTVAPIVHTPSGWEDALYPVYLKNCQFGVPDITGLIPSDSVFQNCGSNQYLTYWQEPAAGSLITQTTVVKLHIVDVCGNDAVLEKTVKVQAREEIITISIGEDTNVCGDDASLLDPRRASNSLASSAIRRASGDTWVQDWDGSWVAVSTTISWDYYRGSVDLEHLIFSQNTATYSHLFEQISYNSNATPEEMAAADAAYAKYMLLLRQTQSDVYWFVAMDTVSGCSDTAYAYIEVRERPRINLVSGDWNLCEGDSLALNGDFGSTFPVCTNDMGTPITAEGWMLNDTTEYLAHMPINYDEGAPHSVYYYATNACGTSTSHNTLYMPCGGLLLTHEDSLAEFGSEEALKLVAQDKYYSDDSVRIEVYTHYQPSQVLLTTNPQDKARIWGGEDAELILTLPYSPATISWRRVEGAFDAPSGFSYDRYGNVLNANESDDVDLFVELWNRRDTTESDSVFFSKHQKENIYRQTVTPSDTSVYYAVVSNGVCPAVASNLVSLDVLNQLPTAITPYDKDSMNDEFMRGHHVIIFNRYGQMIFEGNDGWDGTYRGILADPGVYYYSCDIQKATYKGSIEVVKIR